MNAGDHDRDRDRTENEAHWSALARYLNGDASHEQRASVERWAAASDANRRELAELRALWQLTGVLPSASRVDDLWRGLSERMQRPEEADGPPRLALARATPPAPARRRSATATAAGVAFAASFSLAAGLGIWWRVARPTPAAAPAARAAGATALAARDVTTARGQRVHLQLEDGTAVDLAPETRLQVHASARGPRVVELQGEALFTVTHDARRPFSVRTRRGVAEDLGTTFTVRAPAGDGPAGDDTVRVVVLAGLVSLRAPHAPARDATALRPGQLGALGTGGFVAVETGVDAAAYAAWTRGRVVFREARLRDVARTVGRWYGVDIRIPQPGVAERRVTVDMPPRALREVLDAIAVPLGVRAVRTGRTVVLTPRHPLTAPHPRTAPTPSPNAP